MSQCEVCHDRKSCVECEGTGRCACCESDEAEVPASPDALIERIATKIVDETLFTAKIMPDDPQHKYDSDAQEAYETAVEYSLADVMTKCLRYGLIQDVKAALREYEEERKR